MVHYVCHIKNLTAASQVFADCEKPWEELLEIYGTLYEDMKVDRVIFVASANSEQLPTRLIKCVMDAARPSPNSQGLRRREYESVLRFKILIMYNYF